jgi:hypothetical protein
MKTTAQKFLIMIISDFSLMGLWNKTRILPTRMKIKKRCENQGPISVLRIADLVIAAYPSIKVMVFARSYLFDQGHLFDIGEAVMLDAVIIDAGGKIVGRELNRMPTCIQVVIHQCFDEFPFNIEYLKRRMSGLR